MTRQPLTVAVVGATGLVGRTMIQVLLEREFPIRELRLMASGRSAGRSVTVGGVSYPVIEATPEAFDGVDIALFSAGASVSLELAPAAVAKGATVIDNSNAWRMDPNVPLVVSQVNPADAAGHAGIIANPNCSTMQLAPVLMALRDSVGLERVIVDTYQSVSGTGADALAELEAQVSAHVAGEPLTATVYPHPIAFNALPEIDTFLDNGYTKEEWKVVTESRKILHLPELRISCTAVRVPVFVSHSEAVHVETRRPITPGSSPPPVRGGARGRGPGRSGQPRLSPGQRGGRSRTRCSSAGSARIPRSPMAAAWRSGWSATTCARARRPTRSRSPSCSPTAAGSGRPPSADRSSPAGRHDRARPRGRRLEAIAVEVRACTNCRLHETRTLAVPGEGSPDTEVVFVGEGPGYNEDRQGRPFVGRAGALLGKFLGSLGWQREDVFITNIVKCRPPENRDPNRTRSRPARRTCGASSRSSTRRSS